MTRLGCAGFAVLLFSWAAPAAGQAPHAWLVQKGEVTRFVAAPQETAPTDVAGPGWTLEGSGAMISYPDAEDQNHHDVEVLAESSQTFPNVALGPRGELWLVAENEEGRAWAGFLDAAESFYRHGSQNTKHVKAQGPAVIGRFGATCRVMSLPSDDSLQVQRVQLGGAQGQGAGTVWVRRFMRWLVNPQGGTCTLAEHDTLFLFGFAKSADELAQPDSAGFFLVVPNVERSPGVPRNVNEAWSSVIKEAVPAAGTPAPFTLRVPKAGADPAVQLCSLAEANPGCQWERDLRRRTYVLDPAPPWPRDDPATWGPFAALLNQSCSTLGTAACAPGAGWGQHAGAYLRTDYKGSLTLARAPGVTSTVEGDSVVWAATQPGLDSAASDGRKVVLGIMGRQIELRPLPGKSIPRTTVAVIVGVVLLVAGLAWYAVRRRFESPNQLRSTLLKALGFEREVMEGARALRESLSADPLNAVSFGWAVVRPHSSGAHQEPTVGFVLRVLQGLPRRRAPEPQGASAGQRKNGHTLLRKAAGAKTRPLAGMLEESPRDPGLAVCAGTALARPQNAAELKDALFQVEPAWVDNAPVRRLAGLRDPAALFCLAYELERATGVTDRATSAAWAAMLPEPSTHKVWEDALEQVSKQAHDDPLAWVRLGFGVATEGGSTDEQFEARMREMLEKAAFPQRGAASRAVSVEPAQIERYDQVLLGMWLARRSARRWPSPDTALAGVLLRLGGAGGGSDSDPPGLTLPLLSDKSIPLWLGHWLAAFTPEEAVQVDRPPPPIDEEKPTSEEQVQPELVQVEPNRAEQNQDGPNQGEQIQDEGNQDEQKLFIQLPEAFLAQFCSGVQEALEVDGGGPDWAAPFAVALRKVVRDEAEVAVTATATVKQTQKSVEGAVELVLADLQTLRNEFAHYVQQVETVTGERVRAIASLSERLETLGNRTIELARWVQAQAQQTEAAQANAEAGFAQRVEVHAARAAELWREQAKAIVAPVVNEQVATQWEPYREREQRLDPFIRDVQVIERVQGFLDILKQDEGFIDGVLALREKIPTETWLVLTNPASPYLRLATEKPVLDLVEPAYNHLGEEIRRLPSRDTVRATLEAGSALGYWIDAVWESLLTIDGTLNEEESKPGKVSIRERLRRRDTLTPLGDWSESHKEALEFAAYHANVYRRLLDHAFGGPRRALGEPRYVELVLLEETGLARGDGDFSTRLRQYLEPSAREGCLGKVIRALQYLVEAFPREQLFTDEISRFREALRQRLDKAGLPADFHDLAARVARGIGLEYRPVRYYQSSIDAPGYEFIGREVTRISLTQRLGFDAQPSSDTLVVRVRRPFFFENDTYYAGHAHVARP